MSNFTAEKTDSVGQIFATELRNSDSVHFPLSKIVWGADSNTFTATDTGDPFPVRLYGNNSAAPVFVESNSAQPLFVRGVGDSTLPVSGTVTATVANSSVGVSSALPYFVRGVGDSTVPVSGTVSLSGNNSVVNSSAAPLFIRGVGDSTVPVSGTVSIGAAVPQSSVTIASGTITTVSSVAGVVSVEPTSSAVVGLDGKSSAGGIVSQTFELSDSLAQTVMTAVGRLMGYSLSNPDTAANIFVKIFSDDSAGVTLGTTVPKRNIMVPFGGGREYSNAVGIDMDSGMSIVATNAAGDAAAVTAPSTTIYMTVDFAPST